jgi:flagella basal body P-ring formation protein FlgA
MRRAITPTIFALGLAQTLLGFQALLGAASVAAATRLPVPAVTIYPTDVIRDSMLVDKDFSDSMSSAGFLDRRSDIVGKVARRTLLPGQAISSNSVALPKLVTIGAMVRLVFEEGGLVISTYASALQAGSAGDIISVRNLESGITLSGVVAPDGTIHVGNG